MSNDNITDIAPSSQNADNFQVGKGNVKNFKPYKLFYFVIIVGLLGLASLVLVGLKPNITFRLRELKYDGYPNIAFFNRPEEKPTLKIANSKSHCKIDQWNTCWGDNISAKKSDTVALRLYFKNTSNVIAKDTRVGIEIIKNSAEIKFYGGVISSNGRRTSRICSLKLLNDEILNPVIVGNSFDLSFMPTDTILNSLKNMPFDSLFSDRGIYVGDVKPANGGIVTVYFSIVKNNSQK